MARKYDLISELYNRTCKTVVSNPQNWQAFLASACRNYKLRYDEQLLVYAQRPDATAVLEIEQWNRIFGRWVNRGARGIAVFADENRTRQRLTHYFDISDTHESRYSRTVPIWDMRQEYEADVIETLESTFGEIENKSSLAEAIMGAARNAAEDNIPDYLQDIYYATEGSFLEEVDNDIVASIYKNVVANSVAYMMMSRLGVDTDGYFELDDFRDVTNFNTQETLNALGFATSDIAEMGLTEVSKTITALNRQNRIIVGQDRNEYNKVENNDERSLDNERTDLHNGGRLQPSEPETSTAAGSDFGQIRSDEEKVSEGTSQSPLLQSPDEGRTDTALGGSGTESQQDGRNNPEPDGTERGSDRTDESRGYDEMGSSDERSSQLGTGNRESGSDIRLEYYDRTHEDKSLPFFGRDEVINEILRTTPHLSASLEEIKDYYERNLDNKDRTEYIKSIFNNDYTELTLEDGRTVGYKTFENVLHLWEGKYDSRTAQSFYDWAVIARHFEAMRLLGELSDSIKPLPSMDGQMTFILDGQAEEKKPSAFTFSQEIIDAVLTNGSGFSEGKMRIYEQFEKSLSAKENADFLKNEYGWGGSYPVIIGAGIDESHDGKGITITKGIGKENPHITLSWSQVEKRIGELIRMDRYLNPKEKEHYPRWLESQEERRTKIAETKRNREILSNAPPEQEVEPTEKEPEEAEQPQDVQYEYHLGDKVYIGASEYEILSVDDERVMLYDYDMPLFNKEFSRTEFDRKVRENPMNEHLIVKEEPAEERNEAEEVQTNMGSMPIEDYREIVASQSGFDSYDEMHRQGYRIGNGYDKEPEPVVPAWEQKKKVKGFDLHPDVPMADRHTFNLRENEVETVGKKERFRRNIMAIQLLKKCQEENRFATPEEQIVLSKYVGWGGLSEAFDENNSAWATEYLELSSVLTPEEYASARESTLTAFYTPPEVITAIYKAMEQMGFKEGNLLEPSCGIGNFIGMLPDSMQDSKIYGVELDTISAGIAQQLYQKTTIAAQGFEETNLPDSFFDGVVGNVPFGDFKVSDKRYDKHKFLIHDYFFAKSLDKLRPGGVMAFVTSKGTMDKETLAVRKYIAQRAELASLAERAEQVRGGGVDSSVDNMLKITNDGRKLALDQRMLNDMLPDFEGSKINACVDNIYRIWEENTDKKSAQLVFCDLSTPKNDGTFSVYNDIRKKLIERGIPESEVKFIHEADTDMKKKELFQKTRKGEVRVLLGSTQKMGAGTNVQDKLIALHDVDCPWRPSDLEQRSGRIVRQGNENPQVDIYRYVTEQTFDAYLYQLVEGKQKFASQIMTSKSPVRSAEDIDETALSYAEIKMLATGNPYIKEKMDLDIQVQKLKMLKSNFLSEKYGLEDKVIKFYPQQIAYLKSRVEGLTKDVETAKSHPKPIDEQPLGMMVSGVSYSEKAEAGQAIINACKSMNNPDAIPLGEYRGFQMELYFDTVQRNYVVKLKGETSRDVPLGDDAHGNIVRIDNGIERFEETLADTKNSLENTEKQFETAKQEIEKPFAKEEELRAKTARLDELNILLNMDKKENEIVGGEPDEGEAVGGRKEKSYER